MADLSCIRDPGQSSFISRNAPSIFDTMEDQLGLKLESGKGPVEVLVVDSVQKPSAN